MMNLKAMYKEFCNTSEEWHYLCVGFCMGIALGITAGLLLGFGYAFWLLGVI